MSRYSDINFILNLDMQDGADLITKALEKQQEEKAFRLYTVKYANMTPKTYVPFDKFFNPKKQNEIDDKPVEEILGDVKEMLNTFKGRWTQ